MNRARIKLITAAVLGLILGTFAVSVPHVATAQGGSWSAPLALSSIVAEVSAPTIAVDSYQRVHVVWSEDSGAGNPRIMYTELDDQGWSTPNDIITQGTSPNITADANDKLHAVWTANSSILYSNAPALIAGNARAWTRPFAIGVGTAGVGPTNPQIVASRGGSLNVIYSIPASDQRGIYVVRSDDGGEHWSLPSQVVAGGSGIYTYDARLAVADDGVVHVVWVEAKEQQSATPLRLLYSTSADGGNAWSQPRVIVQGPYDYPFILTTPANEVHIVFSGTSTDRFKFHMWSADGGAHWSQPYRNSDLGGFQGWPSLVADSLGRLHWVQIGSIFTSALPVGAANPDSVYYSWWNGRAWAPGEVVLSGRVRSANAQHVAAVIARGNELHIVFTYPVPAGNAQGSDVAIYHLRRNIASAPAVTPRPVPAILPNIPSSPSAAPTTAAMAAATPVRAATSWRNDGSTPSTRPGEMPLFAGVIPVIALIVLVAVSRAVSRSM